jgi:hypothetical protein
MSVRPETAGNGRGTGGFYARVFDAAWKHAEHMTLAENAGSSHRDFHENDLKASGPERAEPASRKPSAESHPPTRITR